MKKFFDKRKIIVGVIGLSFIVLIGVGLSWFPIDSLAQDKTIDLQVPFPGTDGGKVTVCKTSTGGEVRCGGIADYLVKAYQWTIGFAILLSVLMFVYAGLLWMTAPGGAYGSKEEEGEHTSQVQKAKTVIRNTLVGLILAVTSYLFLYAINPDLTKLPELQLGKKVAEIGLKIEEQESKMEAELDKQTTTGGTPLSGGGEIAQLRAQGLIRTQCVGPGSCSGQKSGEWDQGLQGGGSNPVDPRIRGAIEFVGKTCGPITITGLNEKSGHSASSKHYRGLAVDIGGRICGADPDACTEKQLRLVASLRQNGYGVGTPGGRCGGFKDGPGHFHIQVP